MFSDELKNLRKLGVRHVRAIPWLWPKHALLINGVHLGSPSDPQLCLGHCFRSYDLERSWSDYEY